MTNTSHNIAILAATLKFENKHLCYADRRLNECGDGIQSVVAAIINRYGVSENYAKAAVAKLMTEAYL